MRVWAAWSAAALAVQLAGPPVQLAQQAHRAEVKTRQPDSPKDGGPGEPAEGGLGANETATTTTSTSTTTSYVAPQVELPSLPHSVDDASDKLYQSAEYVGGALDESVKAMADLNHALEHGLEDTLFPPGPVSFEQCMETGMLHPSVVIGLAVYVTQFVYNFRTYMPLRPDGTYVHHSRTQESWEHFWFLIAIDMVIYGLVDGCSNQWAMVGVFYMIMFDGCLQLLRTFAVGWVTKEMAAKIMHVPAGPELRRARADNLGDDIIRWLGAGGSEPGTMLITRRPAMDGTRYTLRVANTYQDLFNPATHVMWLRFLVQIILIFWLHVYLVYTQDVFTWKHGFDPSGKPRKLESSHYQHSLPFFLCSFFIQLLAQDFQGRTFFHNLRWWNFVLVEDIELTDGPVTGHNHQPVLSSEIRKRIWFRMFLAFIANYVLQNIVLGMLPLLLMQETSGFDFAKDVFALTYIANLDDCEEKILTIHHHIAEHHEQHEKVHHPSSLFHIPSPPKPEIAPHAAESPV